jgi:hypothetical protein
MTKTKSAAIIANGTKVSTPKGAGVVVSYAKGWYTVYTGPGSRPAFRAKDVKPARVNGSAVVLGECACGCGETLLSAKRAFRQGHDARFHGWGKRIASGDLDPATIPASARKLFTLVNGAPTTDYDGSPWRG